MGMMFSIMHHAFVYRVTDMFRVSYFNPSKIYLYLDVEAYTTGALVLVASTAGMLGTLGRVTFVELPLALLLKAQTVWSVTLSVVVDGRRQIILHIMTVGSPLRHIILIRPGKLLQKGAVIRQGNRAPVPGH